MAAVRLPSLSIGHTNYNLYLVVGRLPAELGTETRSNGSGSKGVETAPPTGKRIEKGGGLRPPTFSNGFPVGGVRLHDFSTYFLKIKIKDLWAGISKTPCKFIGFGVGPWMPPPCEFIGPGAMDVTKSDEFISFVINL